mmetsp:Transcript_1818/g.5289  ORF Transcript_1818/g.5289 Transcript_1818/m.5289 type:complete len:232 (+) Transcript_1818:2113-2808(+)
MMEGSLRRAARAHPTMRSACAFTRLPSLGATVASSPHSSPNFATALASTAVLAHWRCVAMSASSILFHSDKAGSEGGGSSATWLDSMCDSIFVTRAEAAVAAGARGSWRPGSASSMWSSPASMPLLPPSMAASPPGAFFTTGDSQWPATTRTRWEASPCIRCATAGYSPVATLAVSTLTASLRKTTRGPPRDTSVMNPNRASTAADPTAASARSHSASDSRVSWRGLQKKP